MQSRLLSCWNEDDGVLSFEWVLLVTLVTIGIVGGLAAARDAIIDELGDTAQGMMALDQSFTVTFPLLQQVHDSTVNSASNSSFTDALFYSDCARARTPVGQGTPSDAGPP